jgi:hypothetical protein
MTSGKDGSGDMKSEASSGGIGRNAAISTHETAAHPEGSPYLGLPRNQAFAE